MAEVVVTDQARKRFNPLPELVVVPARGLELADLFGIKSSTSSRLFKGLLCLARFILQEGQQLLLRLGGIAVQFLQFGQGDLGFLILGSHKAQHGFCGPLGRMVEQALVDVADLFDVQGTETQPPRFSRPTARNFDLQGLEGFQQMQDGAVVDGQRIARHFSPCRRLLSAFKERESVRIEQVAAIGRQRHSLMFDAAVHGPEGGKQAAPSIVPPLQDLFAVLIGGFPQLGAKGGNGIVLIEKRIAQEQQAPLLGTE